MTIAKVQAPDPIATLQSIGDVRPRYREWSKHPKAHEYIWSTARRGVVKCGRRGAKTLATAEKMIRGYFLRGRRVTYGTPTSEQLDTCWRECKRILQPLLDAGILKKNETEHIIEVEGTEQRLHCKTIFNADTMRGTYGDLFLDEWQLCDETAWTEVGAPMLLDYDGDAYFIFTPPSPHASGISRARDPLHATRLYAQAQEEERKARALGDTPRWQTFHWTSHDNGYISREALADITLDMSREAYRREILAEDDDISPNLLIYRAFDERSQLIEPFRIPETWPRYVGHDFGCVDEETEILTGDGWKRHEAVEEGSTVLTLNPQTGLAEWQPVLRMNRYNAPPVMCLIEQRGHSSMTTANHRWATRHRGKGMVRFHTTDDLKANDMIDCVAPCSNLPGEPIYEDSFVELIAWFWTEGQVHEGGVSIWQNEGANAEQIRRCLRTEYGEPLTRTRNGRERASAGWLERPRRQRQPHWGVACHFAINLNGADRILAVTEGKTVKPSFIASLTYSQLQLFIATSIKGDGWQRWGRSHKRAGWSINQRDKERLDVFQMACSLAGIRTYLSEDKKSKHPRWLLSLYTRNRIHLGKAKQEPIQYDGLVWCPTTPNSTWLARRNGTVYFTGNSANPAALFFAQDPATGYFYAYHEYFPGRGLSTYQHVLAFKELTQGVPVLKRAGGSHQENEIRQGYTAQGWPIQEPKILNVNARIDRVRAMMEKNQIFVFKTLTRFRQEIVTYLWKQDADGRITDEIANKSAAHEMDCMAYILSDFTPERVAGVSYKGAPINMSAF